MDNFRIKLDDEFFMDIKEATLMAEDIFNKNDKNILQAVCNILEENELNNIKDFILNHDVVKIVINSKDPNNTLMQTAIRHCITKILIDYSYDHPKKSVLNIHLLNMVSDYDCVVYLRNFVKMIIPFLKNITFGEVK